MTIRILPAVGDIDSARALTTLLSQLADAEPAPPVPDTTALLDTLARLAAESLDELPEVVLVHERIGPVSALDAIRDVVMRFPAVGVVLITADTSTGVLTAAMDSGARGIIGLPLGYDALAERVQAAAAWSMGMRRHLGSGTPELYTGPGGRIVTVTGAKGGVGATVAAVQLALAAQASGHSVALLDLDLQSGDVASYLDVQFRRSIADLAGISDINPRVLQDAVYTHDTGLGLLLAPAEGERGEEITDRVARQVLAALRSRYEVVVVDCGAQLNAANAAAVELADQALLLVTPDVVAVRAAKRMVRMWDRLQIRKAEETLTVVNRFSRGTEIQPSLVERVTGTKVARYHGARPPSRSSSRWWTRGGCRTWTPAPRSSRPCGPWRASWTWWSRRRAAVAANAARRPRTAAPSPSAARAATEERSPSNSPGCSPSCWS
jgi:pilus assembly protein CpaE